MSAVARYATRHGWHLDLEMCLSNEVPAAWSGDGIITMRSGDDERIGAFLAAAKCPVLSLNVNSFPFGVPCVAFDNGAAGRLAAEHFLERGFRHFVFYSRPHRGKILYGSRVAFAAFREQIESAGCRCDFFDWLEAQGDGPETWERRQNWLRQKLREVSKPTAVFTPEPDCALEIVDACHAIRVPIPGRVALLCMHGMEFFSECSLVPLSSIDVDNDAKARIACELLAAMMDGAPAPSEPILVAPQGLTLRASTDTLAAENPGVAKGIRFMFDHYSEPIVIDDIVRASGMSRRGFFRVFKADVGLPPHAVLRHIRVDRAKTMLRETDAKLEDVAVACGFNHPVSLHINFKKELGIAPGAYRKQAQEP